MGQGVEAGPIRQLGHRQAGTAQQGLGELQALLLQVMLKAQTGRLVEQVAEVVGRQVGLARGILQAQRLAEVMLDVDHAFWMPGCAQSASRGLVVDDNYLGRRVASPGNVTQGVVVVSLVF